MIDYCKGIICPTHRKYPKECPRSDVYRAMEYGNVQSIWAWSFRCRTCSTVFLMSERKMAEFAKQQGRITRGRENA